MKKRLLSSALALAVAVPSQAAVLVGSYGASTTLGQVASPTTINSVRYNPAAGYLALDTKNGESVRFGYLSQLGFNAEFGKADNFETDIDDLITALDNFSTKLDATQAVIDNPSSYDAGSYAGFDFQDGSGNPDETVAATNAGNAAGDIEDKFNNILASFGENGRLKTSLTASVPGLPVVFQLPKLPGVLSVDASVGFVSLAAFEDEAFAGLPRDANGNVNVTNLSDLNSFSTDSQVVIKGGTLAQVGLGYSQPIDAIKKIGPLSGELVIGAKANLYTASLTSVKAKIDRTDDKEVSDLIEDGLDNSKDSSSFGLDVGAVWVAKNYQAGLTVKNLVSPEFDAYESDEVAGTSGTTTVTMDTQTTVDGAVFIKDRMFMLATSVDLNKVEDLVEDEIQMLHVSGTFFPSNFLIPTLRVGYQKNLAGEELSALNFGAGLFRGMANLDVTYGLETTEVNGSDVSRQLGVQLSFEETF